MTRAMIFWRFIDSSLDRLVGCLAGLDEEGLNWRPAAPEANSLAVLATHMLGNAEENILGILGGEAVERDREAEFRAQVVTATAIEVHWQALRARLGAFLGELSDDALDQVYTHPRRGTLTGLAVLIVVARHAAEHLGQAELTRDLLRAARTADASWD